jgi:two-component system, NtrC family, sensor kinase
MKRPVFIVSLLLISVLFTENTLAQGSKNQRDSMTNVLSRQTGSDKTATLLALAKSYWNTKNDSSFYYAEQARDLADQTGNTNGKAEALRIMGVTNWYRFRTRNEIQPYLDEALKIYKGNGNKKGIADVYNNLGSFYKYVNDFDKSIRYYDSALYIYKTINDLKGEAAVLNYIGICHQQLGDYRKAIDFTLQGLVVRKKTDDHQGIMFSYLNVGNMFLAGGQTEIAIRYYNEAISHADSNQIIPPSMAFNMLGKSYLQLGELEKAGDYLIPSRGKYDNGFPDKLLVAEFYYLTGQLDSAAAYFEDIARRCEKNKASDSLAQALNGLSRIYLYRKNYDKAFELAKNASLVQGQLYNKTVATTAGLLSELYEYRKDPAMALYYLKKQHGIQDSMINSNYQNKLAYFESKNDMDKLEAQMQILSIQKSLQEKLYKQEKLLRNYLLGIAALILLTAFFVIRNINSKRRQIQTQNKQLDEQKTNVEKAYNDLKAAQSQLIQSEKMASLGELTAGIAHEIQNPLNFVNNFSDVNRELLQEIIEAVSQGDLPEIKNLANDIRSNEEKIHEHGKRADAIVKSMLQHSKANAGQKELTDINKLCNECLQLAYHGFRAKEKEFNVKLGTSFDPTASHLDIIPQEIGRVLINLYNNAFYSVHEKFMSTNDYVPTVNLVTQKNSDWLEIMVVDNGTGIPEHIRNKIFQPFFTTKPTGQGTGLGLSLSYDIIKAHGGDIIVESKLGEGSMFTVKLPL